MQSPLDNEYDWPLYKEVNINNNLNYTFTQCLEPTTSKTGGPWFYRNNTCPCDPKLSNPTGRGYTTCPIGVSEIVKPLVENEQNPGMTGSLYNNRQYSPNQFNPYPIARIGESWRTVS